MTITGVMDMCARVLEGYEKKRKKYFSDREIEGLSPRLVRMIVDARYVAKTPFVWPKKRRKKGSKIGASNSAHFRGLAVDIRCRTSPKRYRILAALFKVGFTRIGVYDRHIHADCDSSLPQGVVWMGKSK